MNRRIVTSIGLLATLALVASVCGSQVSDPSAAPDTPEELDLRLELAANLEPFADCDELLDYFQTSAEELGRVPVPGRAAVGAVDGVVDAVPEAAGEAAGEAATGDAAQTTGAPAQRLAAPSDPAGAEYSGTNIQEAGVDEPDLVKTDGRRIVAVAGDRLQVVDATDGAARTVGSLTLPQGGHELFLHDDRAIVLTRSWDAVAVPEAVEPSDTGRVAASTVIAPGAPTTILSAVDLADPANPRVVDDTTFEGDYVTARLHQGTVRIVLGSSPRFLPTDDVAGTEVEDWLPARVLDDDAGAATEPLVECESVTRPPEPSGIGTVTLLTIDASGTMDPIDTDSVVADAQTVYASTQRLYVATNAWQQPDDAPAAPTTELHAFDISDPRGSGYLASGRVRGQLLNQWSLSEHAGHLRVATTDGSPWFGADENTSESFLTVLSREGERLVSVGQVGDLGRGETIHAVRYVGDLGFVVTFRRVDPLYALDLSDPSDPRVLGELKITGFSAYLHPVSDGRLLGVGQEATEEGRTIGAQVSLFDVSTPGHPSRVDQEVVPNAFSTVENDHRAFLWWPADTTAVVPIEVWEARTLEVRPVTPDDDVTGSPPPVAEPFQGALVLSVAGDGIDVTGRVSHRAHADFSPIQRSLVIGDTLYTVSEAGILASDLDTLGERAWAGF